MKAVTAWNDAGCPMLQVVIIGSNIAEIQTLVLTGRDSVPEENRAEEGVEVPPEIFGEGTVSVQHTLAPKPQQMKVKVRSVFVAVSKEPQVIAIYRQVEVTPQEGSIVAPGNGNSYPGPRRLTGTARLPQNRKKL